MSPDASYGDAVLTPVSGYAFIDQTQRFLVIDNISSGFDVWSLSSETHLKSLVTGEPTRFLPRHVAFAESANVVVGGSDHGVVYVFDRKSGAPIDVLDHVRPGLVQTIAVSDTDMTTS